MKMFRYRLEAAVLWIFFLLFRAVGLDRASSIGGWIGRTVGPMLGASKKADRNLRLAMPELSEDERKIIVRGMWDNLGRVIAEYTHLGQIVRERCEIVGIENLDAVGRKSPYVMIGAHQANWELGPFYLNHIADSPLAGLYRAPNNPYAERLLESCRHTGAGVYIPKSQKGARDLVRTLKDGGRIGLLIDQKYNQGIPVEFFGKPAMTSISFAQMALKFDIPVLPLQVERLEGARFRITIHPSFKVDGRTDLDLVNAAHRMMEDWIRQRPAQWLWLHRRWDSKALNNFHNP